VARQLGIGPESLRNWVKRAGIDNGKRPGVTTEQQRRITELERENRELRRANEILKAASAFSRGSSTLDCRSRELYQRVQGPLGGRADL
jgi:transposase-like protein